MEKLPLWKNFKALVDIDLKKVSVASDIKKIELQITEAKNVLPELESSITKIKRAAIDAQKNVDLQELNSKSLSDKEKEKSSNLEKITKQKEYMAIEKEVAVLRQQLHEQDDTLVRAWNALEVAQKKEAKDIISLNEKIEFLKKDLLDKEESLTKLKALYQEIEDQRITHVQIIPENWLKQYDQMIGKVPDPIVPVLNASCSSCYYSVAPQDMTRLKRNAILPCRSCYRFLYYDQEEAQDLEKSSF